MKFRDAFINPSGTLDVTRVLFAMGGVGLAVCPPVFQAWALYLGQTWDPAAFCGGWGAGLGGYLTGGGFGIALKDKGVASAQNTTAPAPPDGGQP